MRVYQPYTRLSIRGASKMFYLSIKSVAEDQPWPFHLFWGSIEGEKNYAHTSFFLEKGQSHS